MLLNESHSWAQKVGPGRKRLPDFPLVAFTCPVCNHKWGWTPCCSVVRTQVRSVTLECNRCGLHFTMTWHQLAKTARKLASGDHHPMIEHYITEDDAELFEELAPEETRGRSPR